MSLKALTRHAQGLQSSSSFNTTFRVPLHIASMASNLERGTARISKVQECDSLHHLHDFRSLFHKASLGCIAIVSTKLTLQVISELQTALARTSQHGATRSKICFLPKSSGAQRRTAQLPVTRDCEQLHGDANLLRWNSAASWLEEETVASCRI